MIDDAALIGAQLSDTKGFSQEASVTFPTCSAANQTCLNASDAGLIGTATSVLRAQMASTQVAAKARHTTFGAMPGTVLGCEFLTGCYVETAAPLPVSGAHFPWFFTAMNNTMSGM